jgi:type IV secretory pathway VirB10-like protein
MARKMKRSLSMVLWGVLFTSVIAGALTLSTLKLLQTRIAKPTAGASPQGMVSAGLAGSPEIVGTENPVPVNPTPELTPTPKNRTQSPTTPAPQVSNLAQNDSQLEPQSPRESVRAKAEQSREKAERMRARVEDLYQRRQISEEAYRKGQAEYQKELAKYEDQIAKYRGATTVTGGTSEY